MWDNWAGFISNCVCYLTLCKNLPQNFLEWINNTLLYLIIGESVLTQPDSPAPLSSEPGKYKMCLYSHERYLSQNGWPHWGIASHLSFPSWLLHVAGLDFLTTWHLTAKGGCWKHHPFKGQAWNYHYYPILLVRANYKCSLDSRGEEEDLSFHGAMWEE